MCGELLRTSYMDPDSYGSTVSENETDSSTSTIAPRENATVRMAEEIYTLVDRISKLCEKLEVSVDQAVPAPNLQRSSPTEPRLAGVLPHSAPSISIHGTTRVTAALAAFGLPSAPSFQEKQQPKPHDVCGTGLCEAEDFPLQHSIISEVPASLGHHAELARRALPFKEQPACFGPVCQEQAQNLELASQRVLAKQGHPIKVQERCVQKTEEQLLRETRYLHGRTCHDAHQGFPVQPIFSIPDPAGELRPAATTNDVPGSEPGPCRVRLKHFVSGPIPQQPGRQQCRGSARIPLQSSSPAPPPMTERWAASGAASPALLPVCPRAALEGPQNLLSQEVVQDPVFDHVYDLCRPCIFFHKGMCEKAADCEFCHFQHTSDQIRRVRPSRSTRACIQRRALARADWEQL